MKQTVGRLKQLLSEFSDDAELSICSEDADWEILSAYSKPGDDKQVAIDIGESDSDVERADYSKAT